MIRRGTVDSSDALKLGIGAMTDSSWKGFYQPIVAIGVYERGVDICEAYTTSRSAWI
jgi:NitT/TauT family transport system substrate-binding protein